MKPILVSSGEPAGIGPDISLQLAHTHLPVVVAGDPNLLAERAHCLGFKTRLTPYNPLEFHPELGLLHYLPISCPYPVKPGQLNTANAEYVLKMLEQCVEECLSHHFSGLVTAPVHKAIINQAGISFSGHTEFIAQRCQVDTVVMMLACPVMKVALVTTHLPLKEVPQAITAERIYKIVHCLNQSFKKDFGLLAPEIYTAGLNPHAGENGYLGREEIEIINPILHQLRKEGIRIHGPYPADSLFTESYLTKADVFLAMYHDQGLSVLKYAGFGQAVNISLGLPIIRTSVDHGTALELAGTQKASANSLTTAVEMALQMAKSRFS